MRLVFDTNVYISAFGTPGSKADLAFRLATRGAFEPITSPAILAEPKFGFSTEELDRVEDSVLEAATLVEPEEKLSVLEDEPDNRVVLECALHSGAAAIVTGDKDLLRLKSFGGIGIMTVAELLYTFLDLG